MILNTTEREETYSFDLKDGYPYFTPKNLLLVDALMRYNSDYSVTIDENHPEYQETYTCFLKNKKESFFEAISGNDLYKVVKSIDKINSTHLMSEGSSVPKGEHDGISKTIDKINEIDNIKERMENGDPKLVYEIASAVETKYNFSFASKFCAYVCEFALDKDDGYCIYDDVVQAILPLYLYRYAPECLEGNYKIVNKNNPDGRRIESTVSRLKSRDNENGYEEYRKLIDAIIKGIQKAEGVEITYSQFDQLLWYYFKGSKQKIQNALNTLLDKI